MTCPIFCLQRTCITGIHRSRHPPGWIGISLSRSARGPGQNAHGNYGQFELIENILRVSAVVSPAPKIPPFSNHKALRTFLHLNLNSQRENGDLMSNILFFRMEQAIDIILQLPTLKTEFEFMWVETSLSWLIFICYTDIQWGDGSL